MLVSKSRKDGGISGHPVYLAPLDQSGSLLNKTWSYIFRLTRLTIGGITLRIDIVGQEIGVALSP